MKNNLIINILYITIPLILSYVIYRLVAINLSILLIIFYGVLLIFLISPEVNLGSMVDYNAKVINPTYRPKRNTFEDSSKDNILSIVVVLCCLVISILVSYFFNSNI
ncbi:hypothetical protein PTB14_13600 [Enterococcus faecalis]|uniref:hypothetical protein n=1 Tax=Enterococcus faecalis TaxID=1351 RepID=UPI002361B53E|nr:hypothetical protein [Enterococcus faecalis]MDD0851432.1 hypothetical protein [Enterococcus faecalis]